MCDTAVANDPPLIVYIPDKYITQNMYDKAVDYSLAVLKRIPDLIVRSKAL